MKDIKYLKMIKKTEIFELRMASPAMQPICRNNFVSFTWPIRVEAPIIAAVAVRKRHQWQNVFTPTIPESAKLFFCQYTRFFMQAYVVWNARIYSKHANVCCAIWIALSVEGVCCMTDFLKTTFEWSMGKSYPDLVQPMMVFRYSNICYWKTLNAQ